MQTIGKTFSAAAEIAYHLTGDYPDWWPGYRFDKPILLWAVGITGESTQKVLQKEIFGTESARFDELIGTGAIPKSKIKDITRDGQRVLMAKIQHVSGGTSTVEFRSTQQGEHVLMGATVDYIHLDEEDAYRSEQIYAQCVTRTATTGGLVTITATPENGLTQLVHKFMEDRSGYLYYQNATWDDAPHLTEENKQELLASFPEWQRDMRARGIPLMGEGLVYPVAEADIRIDPIEIPSHWRRVCAVDIGVAHDTAVAWSAYDAETDTIYVYDVYHAAHGTPADHAPQIKRRGQWIPCIMSHDSENTEKGSGRTVASYYREEGINAQVETFYNPIGADGKKNYFVEPGILEMTRRMKDGRLKIFSSCTRFWEEFRRYHRKDGKIVKTFDDAMDATRYSVMSVTHRGKSLTEYETDQGLYEPYVPVY